MEYWNMLLHNTITFLWKYLVQSTKYSFQSGKSSYVTLVVPTTFAESIVTPLIEKINNRLISWKTSWVKMMCIFLFLKMRTIYRVLSITVIHVTCAHCRMEEFLLCLSGVSNGREAFLRSSVPQSSPSK